MIPKKIISDFNPTAGNYFLYDADGVVRIESLDQSQPFGKALIERYNSHEELQQAKKELKEALQFVVDGVVFSDDGRIWTHWLETFQELLTKYKDL